MIGSKRIPCCSVPARLPDVEDVYHRTCSRCGARWLAVVAPASEVLMEKVGREVLRVTWRQRKVK